MGRIARNYLYNFAYQVLVILVPLVTAPYLTRTVGAEGLGVYGYVNSAAYVIGMVTLLGIYNYGNRQIAYVRDDSEKMNDVFWEVMLLRGILGAVGTIVYVAFSFLNIDYLPYFMLYLPWLIAYNIDCTWLYVGVEDMRPAVLKNVLAKMLGVACIFVFVKGSGDLWKYVLALSLSMLVANASAYPQLKKYVGRPHVRPGVLLGHLKGSVRLFLPSVATLVYLQVDKVLIIWLTGDSAQLAYYDYAEKIVTIPLSIITALSTVMMPRIANEYVNGDFDGMRRHLKSASDFSAMLAFPLAVGFFVIAGNLVDWYLGSDFVATALAIMIISPVVVLNSFEGIIGRQYLTATDKTRSLTRAYSLAAVLNVVINVALLPSIGCYAAAIATVASSLTSVVVECLSVRGELRIGDLLSSSPKYLVIALAMGGVMSLSALLGLTGVALTACQIAAGMVFYYFVLWFTGDEQVRLIGRKVKDELLKRR